MNQNLWLKVKDLLGTEEEIDKLKKMLGENKITVADYWVIRSAWSRNKSIKK